MGSRADTKTDLTKVDNLRDQGNEVLGREGCVKLEWRGVACVLQVPPRDAAMSSETYHYKRGANQTFTQAHIIQPNKYPDDDVSVPHSVYHTLSVTQPFVNQIFTRAHIFEANK